ncbi:hypothetical protein [uncultured Prevotella sp.]|uniref:hypothetical protein n=1 Tax=uncultured Prevotella sp. TaxID=159272 RepID=UPI0027E3580D|nr:hypothetical protein [uncultured Prevotella sp.]
MGRSSSTYASSLPYHRHHAPTTPTRQHSNLSSHITHHATYHSCHYRHPSTSSRAIIFPSYYLPCVYQSHIVTS